MLHKLQVVYMYFWHLVNPIAPFSLRAGDQGFHAAACRLQRKYCEPLTFSVYIKPSGTCYGGQAAHWLLAKLHNLNVGQSFHFGARNNILRSLCVYENVE